MNCTEQPESENDYSQTSYQHNERLLTTLPTAQLGPVMGVVMRTSAVAWSEAVAVFLASGVDSAGTRRAYGRHLRNAGQLFGDVPVAELSGGDLAAYRAYVLGSGLAPSTQAQALSALRSFLGWAGSLGGHHLPAEAVRAALRTPRASVQTRYSVITEKEIGAMFSVAGPSVSCAVP
jgi:site-specific recombinase XerD